MARQQGEPTDNDGEGDDKAVFVGEEAGSGASTPANDLAAACALALFSMAAIWFAAGLKVPATVLTVPALLPALVGVSLLAMAVGLGAKAVRRGARIRYLADLAGASRRFFADVESRRGLLLIGIIGAYVLVLDMFSFDLRLPTAVFEFRFSNYELVSIAALTLILRIFWRATLPRCLLVSAVWVIALASLFRYGFYILLPGSG